VLNSGEHKEHERLVERLLEEGFDSTSIAAGLMCLLQGSASKPSRPETEERERPAARREEPREFRRAQPEARRENRDRKPRPEPGTKPHPARPPSPATHPAMLDVEKPTPAPGPARPAGTSAAETIVKPKIQKPHPASVREPAARKNPPTPEGQTRLYINAGAEMGLSSGDLASAIQGHTGLSPSSIGHVDVRERHSFVDVASEHANAIISKLNRSQIKNRKVKVKVA
jgi:ATP-dependent RNA helicase DeaD